VGKIYTRFYRKLAYRADWVADALGFDFTGKPGIFNENGQPILESPSRPPAVTAAPKPRPTL
jgi:hypothetical protein